MPETVTCEEHLRHFENAITTVTNSNHINNTATTGTTAAEVVLYIINIFIKTIQEPQGTQIGSENWVHSGTDCTYPILMLLLLLLLLLFLSLLLLPLPISGHAAVYRK
jgi:hypothetical protein